METKVADLLKVIFRSKTLFFDAFCYHFFPALDNWFLLLPNVCPLKWKKNFIAWWRGNIFCSRGEYEQKMKRRIGREEKPCLGQKFGKIIQAFLSLATWPGTIHYHTMTFNHWNGMELWQYEFPMEARNKRISIVILNVHALLHWKSHLPSPQKRHYLLR